MRSVRLVTPQYFPRFCHCQGSVALTSEEAKSWRSAALACAAFCAGCSRCEHISVSLDFKDCTWWHGTCTRKYAVPGFRSARYPCDHDVQSFPPPAAPPARHDRQDPLETKSSAELWLAVGVIVPPGVRVVDALHGVATQSERSRGLRFLHQSHTSRLNGTVAWQWVTADEQRRKDPRFVVVPCRDGPFDGRDDEGYEKATLVASACACKTIMWFREALRLFPKARFIAKAEDDSALHDARIVSELRLAWRRHGAGAALWYGCFQWSGHNPISRRNGWWCNEGDELLRRETPYCSQPLLKDHTQTIPSPHSSDAARASSSSTADGPVVAPFPSGGLDVRSSTLVKMIASVGIDATYAHSWTVDGGHRGCEDNRKSCRDNEWAGACDGIQGYIVARTMQRLAAKHGRSPNVTAWHLTQRKFHAPPPELDTSVMHGGQLKGAINWVKTPPDWRYYTGDALLPLAMRLIPTERGIKWQAEDPAHVAKYLMRRYGRTRCGDERAGSRSDATCAPIPHGNQLRAGSL